MPTRSQNFTYSRQELRDILQFKPKFFYCSSEDFHRTHNIPDEIARTPGPLDCQRRSCCSSLLAWLKRNPHRPALPSMFVANARSITNKMDEMHLLMKGNRDVRDCCVFVTSETWLNLRIPDEDVQLAGCSLYRWDRNKDSGKSGGDLCMYMHDDWSTHNLITHTYCSPDIEYICVKSRPFYLPRELTAVLTTAVYILPDANISITLAVVRHHKHTTTILP